MVTVMHSNKKQKKVGKNMSNTKKNGSAGSTNQNRAVVNEKGIVINQTGNNDHMVTESAKPAATTTVATATTTINVSSSSTAERLKLLKQQLVLSREIVNASEFEGEGSIMILDLLTFNPAAETKYGTCLQFSITHPGYPNIKRIWNVKSRRAKDALMPLMEEAVAASKSTLMVKVRTTGSGTTTQYYVEKLG